MREPQYSKQDDEDLLNSREVRRMFGNISEMTLWRWINSEEVRFPKPIIISGKNYWMRRDLRAFRERCAHRDAAESASIAGRLSGGAKAKEEAKQAKEKAEEAAA